MGGIVGGMDGLEEMALCEVSVDTDLGFDLIVFVSEMVGFVSTLESDRDGAVGSLLDMGEGEGLFRSASDSSDDKSFSIVPKIKRNILFIFN